MKRCAPWCSSAARRPATGRYQILIDHRRRPAHRGRRQRAAQVRRGAAGSDDLPALRAVRPPRGRARSPSAPAAGRSRCAPRPPRRSPTCWCAATASTPSRRAGRRRWRAATSGGPGAWPAIPEARRPPRHRPRPAACACAASATRSPSPATSCASAKEEATELREGRDAAEREELAVAMGAGGIGKGVAAAARGAKAAERELEKPQKSRNTRTQRDAIDRALVDLAGFYRDALVVGASAQRAAHQPRPGARRSAAAATEWAPGVGAAQAGGRPGLPHGAGSERQAGDRGRGDDDGAAARLIPRPCRPAAPGSSTVAPDEPMPEPAPEDG